VEARQTKRPNWYDRHNFPETKPPAHRKVSAGVPSPYSCGNRSARIRTAEFEMAVLDLMKKCSRSIPHSRRPAVFLLGGFLNHHGSAGARLRSDCRRRTAAIAVLIRRRRHRLTETDHATSTSTSVRLNFSVAQSCGAAQPALPQLVYFRLLAVAEGLSLSPAVLLWAEHADPCTQDPSQREKRNPRP